jgi:type II secretory pathway pseudopilin PulG
MKERIITLALLAAVSVGVAPAFAQVSTDAASISNNDNLLADCMIQQRSERRVYKKCAKRTAKKAMKRTVSKPI